MGNVFDPAAVPDTQLDAIFAALARLPQRVVLKLDLSSADEEVGEKLPPNVLALPFLPQQEILAHNKTLVFFTHCGSHSVMEAIYHAVPMVGMPIFLDQVPGGLDKCIISLVQFFTAYEFGGKRDFLYWHVFSVQVRKCWAPLIRKTWLLFHNEQSFYRGCFIYVLTKS